MTDDSAGVIDQPRNTDGIGPFGRRHLVAIAAAVLTAATILLALTVPLGARAPAKQAPTPGSSFYLIGPQGGALDIGSQSPDFVGQDGTRLTHLDGKAIALDDLRGRPIWVFFFATWCPPCQQETPDIQRAWEANSDDVAIMGIDVQEPGELVDEYRRTYGLTYRIGVDVTAAVMRSWNIFGLPTHYFIDGDGVIRERQFGPLTLDQMQARIDLIVGAKQ